MTTRDFTANVISASKVVPNGAFQNSAASGVWDINEALDLIKGGNWPTTGNVNPASFVDALFSTDVYTGNGGAKTITNGINLSNSGGLVWFKPRGESGNHSLIDSARGATKYLISNSSSGETTLAQTLDSFNSNGFTVGQYWSENNKDFVTWTFRKQPKFFDIVTYSGDGTSNRVINHSLNHTPGVIIIKNLTETANWKFWHRSLGDGYGLQLNTTGSVEGIGYLSVNSGHVTSSSVTISPAGIETNTSGDDYVMYLFAHNDDDGGFGEPGDQDIIKCGSFSTDSSGDASVTLGFEPQWLMIKRYDGTSNWTLMDIMRGYNDSFWNPLYADTNNAESGFAATRGFPTSTGFEFDGQLSASANYIYMAIRRGGMQTPTAASDVFSIVQNTNTLVDNTKVDFGITPDMHIASRTTSDMSHFITNRLTGGKYLFTNSTSAESSALSSFNEEQTTVEYTGTASNDAGTYIHHGWKRARGYFDVVTWSGNYTARTINHNLGVVPEMMWVKKRGGNADWTIYHTGLGATKYLEFSAFSAGTNSARWNDTAPTSSVFTLGDHGNVNATGDDYIADLFATVAGVSKVGSFTQSGATNISCGFSGDTPSLIILKRTDDTGDWYTFDSTRGVVAGNDPYFTLNGSANTTNADIVDPYSGGFATTSSLTDGDYVFYAIAAIS